ncbi:MAG: sigma-70 family RNA polymerase sigma factor, partial [Gemmatimonadetes bacterium]|nr:sigma-70 family RNA polymerase sigma factor [Gemmatimonadota bacterium]NNL30904.1 sigma-70 family RNA polymerase sigma factor [Gemmatimonadota bacterium]
RWEARLSTWLAGFVVNGARRVYRRQQRSPEAYPPGGGNGSGEDVDLAGVVDRVDLERGIAALPEGARHVFVLHDVEGWTHKEIASRLGIQPGTSKSQLSRARSLLRESLQSQRNDS